MRAFVAAFHIDEETRVLDVGGTAGIWELLEVQPRVTLLNTPGDEQKRRTDGRFCSVFADGGGVTFFLSTALPIFQSFLEKDFLHCGN